MTKRMNLSVSVAALVAFAGSPVAAEVSDHTWRGGSSGYPKVSTHNARPAPPAPVFFPPPPPPPPPSTGGTGEHGDAHDSDSNGRDDGADADAAGAASGPDSSGPGF